MFAWLPVGTALVAGSAVGTAGAYLYLRHQQADAQRKHKLALLHAQDEAEAAARKSDQTIEKEADSLAFLMRHDAEEARHKQTLSEQKLTDRELLAAQRESELSESESKIQLLQEALREQEKAYRGVSDELQQFAFRKRALKEERAQTTQRDVLAHEVQEASSAGLLSAQMRARTFVNERTDIATSEAKRLMMLAIDRYNGVAHLERIQNTIHVPDQHTLMLLGDVAGPGYAAFQQEVGCELVLDESNQTLNVRGDDPLAREIARRVVHVAAARSIPNADRVRKIASQMKAEIQREVEQAGRRAVHLLELGKVHPDILNLVGRLKYRLSYSQNQWKHSVEVAYLSGIIAQEMGLDVRTARRGGLLHDIGKAMTHDHEGSHAVLGAEVARRCGELEVVANAIGSHHNDEPPESAIAHIVTAADAMSGARPGARREADTQYLTRLEDIHRIAERYAAVKRVDIMQGGREVRITVAGQTRGDFDPAEHASGPFLQDHELQPLASSIAREIESELTFAGQIRVTVIRESRAMIVAM